VSITKKYLDYDLPGCNIMWFCRSPLMFWRNTLRSFPGLKRKPSKVEVVHFSETVMWTSAANYTVLAQKIMLFIVTAVRTSNQTYHTLPIIILILLL
jgi:hypothetical protein